jgi:mono/diheme cytochrome c family protein
MRRLPVIAFAAVVLAIAGCGGGEVVSPTPETVVGSVATPEVQVGNAEAGVAVFNDQGCGSCHTLSAAGSTGNVGPNLDEALQGKDAAFVHQSIVNPNAVVAEGFQPGVMPQNYGQSLTPKQIADLVAALLPQG